MNEETLTQRLLFPNLWERDKKPVVIEFDQRQMSSDGGGILLKAADQRLRLTERLAGCIRDEREKGKVKHEMIELMRQRVLGIACGYEDCNDAARLGNDPMHKLMVGRDPVEGAALGSQAMLSRFENTPDRKELYRMGEELADTVIQRHRKRLKKKVKKVRIDMDPTDDPTHGCQQLSFFNGHYDTSCYLPMLAFISFNKEKEQYLIGAVLRPGNAPAKKGAIGILSRIISRVREAFPKARIEVRLDGGFAGPQMFDYLDSEARLEYEVGMAGNAVLARKAEKLMREARRLSRKSGQTEHVYGQCQYAAKSWSHERRVIIKAEVVRNPDRPPKENPRFVVTNKHQSPRFIYEDEYCARGEIENRIKELHEGVQIDRTSCTNFWANQFRVLMSAAAYVLMQEIRLQARNTDCARAQVTTLRERLIKLGARVVESVRRIVIHLPETFAYSRTWHRVAAALGARPG